MTRLALVPAPARFVERHDGTGAPSRSGFDTKIVEHRLEQSRVLPSAPSSIFGSSRRATAATADRAAAAGGATEVELALAGLGGALALGRRRFARTIFTPLATAAATWVGIDRVGVRVFRSSSMASSPALGTGFGITCRLDAGTKATTSSAVPLLS